MRCALGRAGVRCAERSERLASAGTRLAVLQLCMKFSGLHSIPGGRTDEPLEHRGHRDDAPRRLVTDRHPGPPAPGPPSHRSTPTLTPTPRTRIEREGSMSNFAFLQAEWPALHEEAIKAEAAVYTDPRTACFHARRTLELLVNWAYKVDVALRLPYRDDLSALLHEPTFKAAAGQAVHARALLIKDAGKEAVHSRRPVRECGALAAVRDLFHVGDWLAHTYARQPGPAPGLAFDASVVPQSAAVSKRTLEQLQKLEAGQRERDEKLSVVLAGEGT